MESCQLSPSGIRFLSTVLTDAGLCPSRSAARRLLQQGAVDIQAADAQSCYLRVGKRRYLQVRGLLPGTAFVTWTRLTA